ncbi:hypothetical protein MTR_8g046080 [Medicago truncatula]|uniref:Uncharacterized protein n=1 Tax=Medicago truncatula TaxID=3880 RepID=G7L8I3_MEDTR|nr:hypothetical protein MTR_8g046080 [Medicago truncatula]
MAAPAAPSLVAQVQPLQLVRPTAPVQSFAQVLSSSISSAPNEPLPQPTIRGESVSIRILQMLYEKGIEYCTRNLRGRLILSKGDKSYSSSEI